jgi:hypothetical protein
VFALREQIDDARTGLVFVVLVKTNLRFVDLKTFEQLPGMPCVLVATTSTMRSVSNARWLISPRLPMGVATR